MGNIKMKDLNSSAPAQLSRRERAAIENERKRQAWLEKHKRGETDEARKDLARLKLIRKRREEQQKREEQEELSAAQRSSKVVVDDESSEDELEKLTSREIKKMNPTKLKTELKRRKLDCQGSKKVLQKRLLDWAKENS